MSISHTHDPLRPHTHDPNPEPPSADPAILLTLPDGITQTIQIEDLQALPEIVVPNCYIVSTGHGTSGPFAFKGTTLLSLIEDRLDMAIPWSQVEVISADGFGNSVMADELYHPDPAGPILLAYAIDHQLMTRQQGLVRLIVPNEKDDALRQVKWVSQVNVSRKET